MKEKIKLLREGIKKVKISDIKEIVDGNSRPVISELVGQEFEGKEGEILTLIKDELEQLEKIVKKGSNFNLTDGTVDFEIQDYDCGLPTTTSIKVEFIVESLPDGEIEEEVEFEDSLKEVPVEVNGQNLVFKFRKLISAGVKLPCTAICPYGDKCDKIPNPKDLEDHEIDFMYFCGTLGMDECDESLIDTIPVEGTIEEEFKKIGIEI